MNMIKKIDGLGCEYVMQLNEGKGYVTVECEKVKIDKVIDKVGDCLKENGARYYGVFFLQNKDDELWRVYFDCIFGLEDKRNIVVVNTRKEYRINIDGELKKYIMKDVA